MKIESSVVSALSSPRPYLFAALKPHWYQFARLASKMEKSSGNFIRLMSREKPRPR